MFKRRQIKVHAVLTERERDLQLLCQESAESTESNFLLFVPFIFKIIWICNRMLFVLDVNLMKVQRALKQPSYFNWYPIIIDVVTWLGWREQIDRRTKGGPHLNF